MIWTTLFGALLVFGLRLADVAMGTVRTRLTMRGRRAESALIGFVEVLLFVLAFTRVMSNIDNIWNVLAYCGGFAAGTLLGLSLEERLALGYNIVRIVTRTEWEQLTLALHDGGFGATQVMGQGRQGPVAIVYTIVRRRQVPAVLALCDELASDAFITIETARQVYRGTFARAMK